MLSSQQQPHDEQHSKTNLTQIKQDEQIHELKQESKSTNQDQGNDNSHKTLKKVNKKKSGRISTRKPILQRRSDKKPMSRYFDKEIIYMQENEE